MDIIIMGIAIMVIEEETIAQDIVEVGIAIMVAFMAIVDIAIVVDIVIVVMDIIVVQDTTMVIVEEIIIMGIDLKKNNNFKLNFVMNRLGIIMEAVEAIEEDS